jgi:phosphonate transport system substrate-binding protein
MRRRTYLGCLGGLSISGVAGCLGTTTTADAGPVGTWADGDIEFGLPPFQNAEDLLESYRPTFDWLEAGFDSVDSVTGTTTTSYSAVVESVVNGHTELANLSPVTYVLAAADGIHPLVLNWSHGRDFYRSYIATRTDTGIESLADVAGETVAMVDPLSTSGGMFPRYMLAEAGLDVGDMDTEPGDFDIEWAFGHDASLRALQEGHVDAAAYGDFQHPDDSDRIVKLAESQPIPFDPIVARPDAPEDVREAITERLLETPAERLEEHRIDKFGRVDDDTYDPVRDVVEEMGVELGDLDED